MITTELRNYLIINNNKIWPSSLIDGTIENLRRMKLERIIVCDYCSLRSPAATETANRVYESASVALIGGLQGILKFAPVERIFSQYIDGLNIINQVVAILLPEEREKYRAITLRLNNLQFYRDEAEFYNSL